MTRLLMLLLGHFVSDFTLQTPRMVERKNNKFTALLVHAAIYTAVISSILFLCTNWKIALLTSAIIALSHFLIDHIRILVDKKIESPNAHFISFVIDQLLHTIIIGLFYFLFIHQSYPPDFIASIIENETFTRIVVYSLIVLINWTPASIFIQKLISCLKTPRSNNEDPQAGRIIGKLERIIIAIFLVLNEFEGIIIILTAKSIARFKEFEKDHFAEKYLIGTLSSMIFSIISTLLLLKTI